MRRKIIACIGGLVLIGLLLVLLGFFPALVAQVFGLGAPNLERVCKVMITAGLVLLFGLVPLGAWLVHKESQNFKGFGGSKRYGHKRTGS